MHGERGHLRPEAAGFGDSTERASELPKNLERVATIDTSRFRPQHWEVSGGRVFFSEYRGNDLCIFDGEGTEVLRGSFTEWITKDGSIIAKEAIDDIQAVIRRDDGRELYRGPCLSWGIGSTAEEVIVEVEDGVIVRANGDEIFRDVKQWSVSDGVVYAERRVGSFQKSNEVIGSDGSRFSLGENSGHQKRETVRRRGWTVSKKKLFLEREITSDGMTGSGSRREIYEPATGVSYPLDASYAGFEWLIDNGNVFESRLRWRGFGGSAGKEQVIKKNGRPLLATSVRAPADSLAALRVERGQAYIAVPGQGHTDIYVVKDVVSKERVSEARAAIALAERVGMSQEERRTVLAPGAIRAEIAEQVDSELVDELLARLDGSVGRKTRGLVRFGSALRGIEMRLGTERGDKDHLTQAERLLLQSGLKHIEKAFYDGSLARLQGEDAAVIAFLVNRLAKIAEKDPQAAQLLRFETGRLRELIAEVAVFAGHVLGDEALGLRSATLEKQERDVQERLSTHPLFQEEERLKREKEVFRGQGPEELEKERLIKFFFEMRKRCETTANTIHKYLPDHPEGRFLSAFARALRSYNLPYRVETLAAQMKKMGGSEQTFADAFEKTFPHMVTDAVRDSLPVIHAPLSVYKENMAVLFRAIESRLTETRAPKKSSPSSTKAGFTALGSFVTTEQRAALESARTFLQEMSEDALPEGIRELFAEKRKAQELDLAEKNLVARIAADPEATELQKQSKDVEAEKKQLPLDRQRLAERRALFRRSKEDVLAAIDTPRRPGDLYFLKTFLVAADESHKLDTEQGRSSFVPDHKLPSQDIATHTFLSDESSGRDRPSNPWGDEAAPRYRYSDIHYRTLQHPFAQYMVEYLKSLSRSST